MSNEPGQLQRVRFQGGTNSEHQSRPGDSYLLPKLLPVRSSKGPEELVSTLELLQENDPLTPAVVARIAWLFESEKREWCRLVCEHFPQNKELQAAVEAIESVPENPEERVSGWNHPDAFWIWHFNTENAEWSINRQEYERWRKEARREQALHKPGDEEWELWERRIAQKPTPLDTPIEELQRAREQSAAEWRKYALERAKEERLANLQIQVEQLQTMQQETYIQVIASAAQQALGTLLPQHVMPPEPAPIQPPAPYRRKKTAPHAEVLSVKEFGERVGMDRNEVLARCRNGSIRASQGNGPGSKWRISTEEAERYAREGPYGQTTR